MVLNRDCSAGTLVLADRYVLLEGRGALNRRLIHLLMFIDIVYRSIRGYGALMRGTGVNRAEVEIDTVFVDVIFDQRAGGPACVPFTERQRQ
jgi:hypothetical protein